MLAPLLLSAAGLGLAYLPVLLGWSDLPAAVPVALLVAGAAWGGQKLFRERSRRRTGLWMCQLAALGLHAVWYFALSDYAISAGAPGIGEAAPEISAQRVRDGATFRLGAQRGHAVLLVFFRGSW